MEQDREIKVRDLGLAAYIKMVGGRLIRFEERMIVFRVKEDKTVNDYRMEYLNTCCFRHDSELMTLRKLIKGSK